MDVRRIGRLKQDQARMLGEIKAAREAVPARGAADLLRPITGDALGRVTEAVASDPQHGPHLKVVLQYLHGAPPVAVDASPIAVVCYPPPGAVVSAFAEDEYVWVSTLSGARVARKL